MSIGTMIAINAAQAAAQARARVLDAFRLRGATAPDRARPLAELGIGSDDRALAPLLVKGVVRAVDERGRPAVLGHEESRIAGYYLDEAAWIADRERTTRGNRRGALIAISISVGILVSVLIALLIGG